MNKINFTAKDNFPLSSDAMEMMQQMIGSSADTALLGGSNYILSGCADDGSGNVSSGIIVINGELLTFAGGAKRSKITIQQTGKTLSAFGVSYPEACVYRTAVFSDTGEYNWSDFVQVLTNKQIEEKINSLKSEEAGFVKMWSGRIDRIPEDYRLCNGDTIITASYPELAYSLGKDSESSFNLPDLRKRFVVGYDNSSFDYNAIGKTGGQETVTLSIDQMPIHSHTIKFMNQNWGDNANSRPFPDPGGSSGYTAETTSAGGGQLHENRPPYYTLAYVIKVR
ncbi:MAG: tail fiber protein [Tannerellaceae bacterium]|jgi:microcystin-dependent protein|nr:tail fiber protein [Tannerellaceae bacterium]